MFGINCSVIRLTLIPLLLVASCTGGNEEALIAGTLDAPADLPAASIPQLNSVDSSVLPLPEDALASFAPRSTSAVVLERNGSDYGRDPHGQPLAQNVEKEGLSARFRPTWTDDTLDIDRLAYAIYSFNVQGFAGDNVIQLDWAEPLSEDSAQWIGLSCWANNSWQWHPVSTDGNLSLDGRGFTDYSDSDTGEMLVVVVLLGNLEALLEKAVSHDRIVLNWWMFGHDQRHTHRSWFVAAQTNSLRWSFQTMGKISSSPAFGSDGTIYVANHVKYDIGACVGNLYAVNPDGTEKWSCTIGSYVTEFDYVISSPAVTEEAIYVGSLDHKLYAINLDGTYKWSFETGDKITSSPVVDNEGTVYVGSHDGNFYAINPNGSLKWSFAAGSTIHSSPAIGSEGVIYVASNVSDLYAIYPSGSQKWQYSAMTGLTSSPAIGVEGTVYIGDWESPGDFHGRIYAINPDGTPKGGSWPFLTGTAVLSSPAIDFDGRGIYCADTGGTLFSINPDGSQNWSLYLEGASDSSPALGGDGTVYLGSYEGKLYAVDANGSLKWSFATGDKVRSSPAIGMDGTVYVGSDDGKLYAFGQ